MTTNYWSAEAMVALVIGLFTLGSGFIGWLIFIAHKAGKMALSMEHMVREQRLTARRMGMLSRHVNNQNGRIGKLEVKVEQLEDDTA